MFVTYKHEVIFLPNKSLPRVICVECPLHNQIEEFFKKDNKWKKIFTLYRIILKTEKTHRPTMKN